DLAPRRERRSPAARPDREALPVHRKLPREGNPARLGQQARSVRQGVPARIQARLAAALRSPACDGTGKARGLRRGIDDAMRPTLLALAISGPVACCVIVSQLNGPGVMAHAAAFAALVLGLPWVVPTLMVVAVLSAPIYIALHVAGHAQELMPW